MNTFWGADTDGLREAAELLADRAVHLRDLEQTCRRAIAAAAWSGPDADAIMQECDRVLPLLSTVAEQVRSRAAALDAEADEQDRASAASAARDGGAWQPGEAELFPGINPWAPLVPWSEEELERAQRSLGEFIDWVKGEFAEHLADFEGAPAWFRVARRAIPVLPEVADFLNHAVHGETERALFALGRGVVSATPLGYVEDASAVVFPMLPDDVVYPGSDVPLNEGSIMEVMEQAALENPDSRIDRSIREGEMAGARLSEQLGIDDPSVRNVFRTVGGISAAVAAGHRDPVTDGPWYLGKDLWPW